MDELMYTQKELDDAVRVARLQGKSHGLIEGWGEARKEASKIREEGRLQGRAELLKEIDHYAGTLYGAMSLRPDAETRIFDHGWKNCADAIKYWCRIECGEFK